KSVASGLKNFGPSYRNCYAWYGPNQPGINETDPSNPGGCVPDPGGHPPYGGGPSTSACKQNPPLTPFGSPDRSSNTSSSGAGSGSSSPSSATSGGSTLPLPSTGGGGAHVRVPATIPKLPGASGLKNALGSIVSALGGRPGGPNVPAAPSAASGGSSSGGSSGAGSSGAGGQAQQLLNYLLSP